MGKLKFALSNVLYWLAILLAVFFVENVPLLTGKGLQKGFSSFEFSLLIVLIIGLFALYFFTEHKKNHMKFDYVLLGALPALCILNILATWFNPTLVEGINPVLGLPYKVVITNENKIYYTAQIIASFIGLYATCFCFSRWRVKTRLFSTITLIFILYTVVSIILSFFLDATTYQKIFNLSLIDELHGIESFYTHKNIFGLGLLLGILACFMYAYYKPKWYIYALIPVFLVFLALTTSETSLLIALGACFLFFIIELVTLFKNHKIKRAVIILVTSVIVIALAGFILIYSIKHDLGVISQIARFIKKSIFEKEHSSFHGRIEIWQESWSLISSSPLTMLIGRGRFTVANLINACDAVRKFENVVSCHSGYMEILVGSGFIGLGVYLISIVYLFYVLIRLLIRKNTRFVFISFTIIFSLLVHSVVESTYLFAFSITGLTVMWMFLLPILTKWKQAHHIALTDELKKEKSIPHLSNKTIKQVFVKAISFAILSFALLFISENVRNSFNKTTFVIASLVFLIISLITIPMCIETFDSDKHRKKSIVVLLSIYALFILLSLGCACFAYSKSKDIVAAIKFALLAYLMLMGLAFIYGKRKQEITFSSYFKNLLKEAFVTPLFSLLIALVVEVAFILLTECFITINTLILMLLAIILIVIYMLCLYLIPSRKNREDIESLNLYAMNRYVIAAQEKDK